jgi:hypothetical protein
MPDPSTTRLALYKSKSDGSELVNYTQDLGQNWDKVDAAAGFQVVTSSTRPSAPYPGKPIMQSDTAYSTYVSNGTSPASGSWVEIPNSSAVYGGRFISLFSGSTSAASLMRLAQTGSASGSRAFATRGATDTSDHFFFDFDGRMQWSGGGASAGDTNLYRSAANVLKTDDAFQAQSVSGIQVPVAIVKTTTTSRASTTTLTADPDFTASVASAGTYMFELMLQCSGAALNSGDIKLLVQYSGTVTSGTWQGIGMSTSGTTNIQNNGGSVVSSGGVSQPFGVAGASFSGIFVSGGIVAGTSGTLSLLWAQNTSSATATNVRLGSWFRVTQTA